jgi:adenylate kinase family enzyme
MKYLILLKGKPGAGKSTIASLLAKKMNCPVLHKDDLNDVVFSFFGANSKSSELVYEMLGYFIKKLSTIVERGIIVDCSLSTKKNYLLFKKLSQKIKLKLIVVEVLPPETEELERRLNQRNNLPAHRIKSIKDIEKQGLFYENYPIENLINIKNDKAIEKVVRELSKALSIKNS